MKKATKRQWITFTLVTILYLAFVIWNGNYWLLSGIPLIFDIYISRLVPWGAWKKSNNKIAHKIAEWVDAILFALIAVYFINIFIFQMYKIPSSSLEKTLLVGDFLLVDKLSYGPRIPNTPLSLPLVHNTLPIINTKSYLDWIHWDYKRLKGFGKVKRNDIVVFNFPTGDTVAFLQQNPDYYWQVEQNGWEAVNSNPHHFGDILYRPVDRKENYVKRCIGMPGDSLQIIENEIFINGKFLPPPKKVQFYYFVETQGGMLTEKQFRTLNISSEDYKSSKIDASNSGDFFESIGIERNESGGFNPVYWLPLTSEAIDILKKRGWARSIRIEKGLPFEKNNIYPYGYDLGWTRDNYGPIWIPEKGVAIELNEKNLALYSHCIVNYEGNTLRQSNGKIYINDHPADQYTFKYDYYFMMGDNRHKSADSRSWGFVPEDHIVGKPLLVWLSIDKDRSLFNGGIRWNRIFTRANAL